MVNQALTNDNPISGKPPRLHSKGLVNIPATPLQQLHHYNNPPATALSYPSTAIKPTQKLPEAKSPFSSASDHNTISKENIETSFSTASSISTSPKVFQNEKVVAPYQPPHSRKKDKENICPIPAPAKTQICSVYSYNLEDEFVRIRKALVNHTFATFDTEFDRHIYHSEIFYYDRTPEERYDVMRANVDSLNLNQLGLALTDAAGNLSYNCVWQFNFRGMDKINYSQFKDMIRSSGLVCNDSRISWVSFGSPYDYGYVVKILIGCRKLPFSFASFMSLVKQFFGTRIYDVKHLAATLLLHRVTNGIGLNDLGKELEVRRTVGTAHNSSSDSLLTSNLFHKIRRIIGDDKRIDHGKGLICGLHVI